MTTDNNSSLSLGDNPTLPNGVFESPLNLEDVVVTTPQEDGTNQPVVNNDDAANDVITISRKQLAADIDRLRLEDKDFAQVYSRDIGNKAAQRYKPEIEALRRQNDALALAIRRAEYGKLTQEEVNSKFTTDAKFAEDYARVTHAPEPKIENIQPDANAISSAIVDRVNNIVNFAGRVLPSDKVEEIKADIAAGKFDKDDSGEPYDLYTWREGLDRLEQHVASMVRQPSTNTTPNNPVSQPVVVSPQLPRVNTNSPDLSPSGSRGATNVKFTMQQVRAMSWDEQLKRWPNEGDLEHAVESGEITLSP